MRKDGKPVKNIPAFGRIIPYIMSSRQDSQNMFRADIDAKPIDDFINKWRKQDVRISRMTLILSAYLRIVSEHPALNRFVVGKTIYARNHFVVSFVMLKGDSMDGEETVVKIPLELDDSVFDVARKVDDAIIRNREMSNQNSTDELIEKIMRVPLIPSLIVAILKGMDRMGFLPRSIIDASPFHTSLFLSNLASLRMNYIYHHLYEFGTTSEFITMGQQTKTLALVRGEVVEKKMYPLGIVLDERICPGDYFARCFKRLEHFLRNPHLLEERAKSVEFEV